MIIRDTILFQAIQLETLDKHLEVQAIELNAHGNNIKIVNTYIPPLSSCDAGHKTSISKVLELDDCIIVGDFNAHIPIWHSKLPEDTKGTNIASEIELSNDAVLSKKSSTRITDSCKSSRTSNSPAQA